MKLYGRLKPNEIQEVQTSLRKYNFDEDSIEIHVQDTTNYNPPHLSYLNGHILIKNVNTGQEKIYKRYGDQIFWTIQVDEDLNGILANKNVPRPNTRKCYA